MNATLPREKFLRTTELDPFVPALSGLWVQFLGAVLLSQRLNRKDALPHAQTHEHNNTHMTTRNRLLLRGLKLRAGRRRPVMIGAIHHMIRLCREVLMGRCIVIRYQMILSGKWVTNKNFLCESISISTCLWLK